MKNRKRFVGIVMALAVSFTTMTEPGLISCAEEFTQEIITDDANQDFIVDDKEKEADVNMEGVDSAEIGPEETEMEEKEPNEEETDNSEPAEEGIFYQGHQQDYGDLESVKNGEMLGSTGKSKRLEAISINRIREADNILEGSIRYRAHVQDYGWQRWREEGELAGTTGESKRLEAIQIELTGVLAEKYDIYYRVHVESFGWLEWASNGMLAGTEGLSRRVEAVEIKIVEKEDSEHAEVTGRSYLSENSYENFSYSGHQQSYGDLESVETGEVLGITGQSKRLEGITINRDVSDSQAFQGDIRYRVHCQDYGWLEWVKSGAYAGTKGESKRAEAIEIQLIGELAAYCDVWYRVHVQEYGWLGWAKNGQAAGTTNCSYRMEAIEIRIIPKWMNAPGKNAGYYKDRPIVALISSFSTHATSGEGSWFNMKRALAQFNGIVVKPGATLSFNGTTGYCGPQNGYVLGGVVGGMDYGGGICQASTTLYGAAIRAGMDIIQRRNHSIASTYVPRGLDAMVNWGTSDLKVRNNFSFPLTIRTWTQGRDLYVEIYGADPEWFDTVEVNAWITGAHSASASRTYYKNGKKIRTESLPNSYYQN